jgi:hypothetical protein
MVRVVAVFVHERLGGDTGEQTGREVGFSARTDPRRGTVPVSLSSSSSSYSPRFAKRSARCSANRLAAVCAPDAIAFLPEPIARSRGPIRAGRGMSVIQRKATTESAESRICPPAVPTVERSARESAAPTYPP